MARPCSSFPWSASNACEPAAAQGPALVRPQRLAARAAAEPAVHAAGRPPVHARRGHRRRPRRRRRRCRCSASARCTRSSARTSDGDRAGAGGRRPLPRAAGTDQGCRDRRRDQRQAHAARASTSTRTPASAHLRTLAAAAEAQGSYLWIDMEDSALRRPDAGPLPAPPRHAPANTGSASRRTCAARPRTSSGCCRSTRRSAWSRAPTTSPRPSPSRSKREVDAQLPRRSR